MQNKVADRDLWQYQTRICNYWEGTSNSGAMIWLRLRQAAAMHFQCLITRQLVGKSGFFLSILCHSETLYLCDTRQISVQSGNQGC